MTDNFCKCHEVAIILKSGFDKSAPCPACGLPREWFFSVIKGKGEVEPFTAMKKREPFTCENPNPILEPGELWWECGNTPEEAFRNLINCNER